MPGAPDQSLRPAMQPPWESWLGSATEMSVGREQLQALTCYGSTLLDHCPAGAIMGETRDRHRKVQQRQISRTWSGSHLWRSAAPLQANQSALSSRNSAALRESTGIRATETPYLSFKLALLCRWAPALLHRVICQGRLPCHWPKHSGRRGMSHLQTGLPSISLFSNTSDAHAASQRLQRLWIDCGDLYDCICMAQSPTNWSSAMMMAADAGVDDAQAILIALSQPGVNVEAISAVHGNVVSKATSCIAPSSQLDATSAVFAYICRRSSKW